MFPTGCHTAQTALSAGHMLAKQRFEFWQFGILNIVSDFEFIPVFRYL